MGAASGVRTGCTHLDIRYEEEEGDTPLEGDWDARRRELKIVPAEQGAVEGGGEGAEKKAEDATLRQPRATALTQMTRRTPMGEHPPVFARADAAK